MADLTIALTDLATAITGLQSSSPTAAVQAELDAANAKIADLEAQLAARDAADQAAGDQVEAAVSAINSVVNPPAAPTPEPTPEPAAVLPEYTYSGDPTAIDPAWMPTGTSTPDGLALYTYSGDTAGQPATGDGLGGVWHLYAPPTQ